MERYSKVYSSKWQSQYSEEFKRFVCDEYLQGDLSRKALERKYKLGNTRLTVWLKEYGYQLKKVYFAPLLPMPKPINLSTAASTAQIEQLKKELEQARLEAEAYRKMIEIAERDLKINIRKKSNTKQ